MLSFDEMHIGKNLVYRKKGGVMVGYVKLGEVFQELRTLNCALERAVDNTSTGTDDTPMANKILT